VRELGVDRAAKNFGVDGGELFVAIGERSDFRRAHKGEIERVEEEHDVLASVVAQLERLDELLVKDGVGGEVRRRVTNQRCARLLRTRKHTHTVSPMHECMSRITRASSRSTRSRRVAIAFLRDTYHAHRRAGERLARTSACESTSSHVCVSVTPTITRANTRWVTTRTRVPPTPARKDYPPQVVILIRRSIANHGAYAKGDDAYNDDEW